MKNYNFKNYHLKYHGRQAIKELWSDAGAAGRPLPAELPESQLWPRRPIGQPLPENLKFAFSGAAGYILIL
jgi:hypothetical protein